MAEERARAPDVLDAIMRWYAAQCDGDWEHDYGITIESLDNPGWRVRIDTVDTKTPLPDMPKHEVEMGSPKNWQAHWVEDGVFYGAGAPGRLGYILAQFLDLLPR